MLRLSGRVVRIPPQEQKIAGSKRALFWSVHTNDFNIGTPAAAQLSVEDSSRSGRQLWEWKTTVGVEDSSRSGMHLWQWKTA